jgi:hypothetical protein
LLGNVGWGGEKSQYYDVGQLSPFLWGGGGISLPQEPAVMEKVEKRGGWSNDLKVYSHEIEKFLKAFIKFIKF